MGWCISGLSSLIQYPTSRTKATNFKVILKMHQWPYKPTRPLHSIFQKAQKATAPVQPMIVPTTPPTQTSAMESLSQGRNNQKSP